MAANQVLHTLPSEVTRPFVGVRGIIKRFGSVGVLHDVSLDVGKGEFVTLLGPSGSGKTTLLQIIAGFVPASGGSVEVEGHEILDVPPNRRGIGFVFQKYALFPHMSVAQNVGYPLRLRGVSKAETARRVNDVLAMVQLAGFGDRAISQLSGGQQQRVALARAIVFEPKLLLMDEPLSALDKRLREQMQIEIRQLHDRLGVTTIFVTHDQREAMTMSDRIAIMDAGRIVQFDPPRTVYQHPTSRFSAEFMGETTFIPLERSGSGGLLLFGHPFHTASDATANDMLLLALRPEKLRLVTGKDGLGHGGDVNVFAGVLRRALFQGDSVLLRVELASGDDVDVRVPSSYEAASRIPGEGGSVELALHAQDAVVVSE